MALRSSPPSSRRSGERVGELAAAGDLELAIDMAEVPLGGLGGDEQRLRDLAIGQALGGEPCDAQLAGGQRVAAGDRVTPRLRARRDQLRARLVGDPPRTATVGEIQRALELGCAPGRGGRRAAARRRSPIARGRAPAVTASAPTSSPPLPAAQDRPRRPRSARMRAARCPASAGARTPAPARAARPRAGAPPPCRRAPRGPAPPRRATARRSASRRPSGSHRCPHSRKSSSASCRRPWATRSRPRAIRNRTTSTERDASGSATCSSTSSASSSSSRSISTRITSLTACIRWTPFARSSAQRASASASANAPQSHDADARNTKSRSSPASRRGGARPQAGPRTAAAARRSTRRRERDDQDIADVERRRIRLARQRPFRQLLRLGRAVSSRRVARPTLRANATGGSATRLRRPRNA